MELFVRAVLASHQGVCTTVAEADMMVGAPQWFANAIIAVSTPLVVLPDAAMWDPREVGKDGVQRSEERSVLCGGSERMRVRASAVTVEYGAARGWPWRRVRRTIRGAHAACVQHAMELLQRGRVCE